jgi:hypothetical protein
MAAIIASFPEAISIMPLEIAKTSLQLDTGVFITARTYRLQTAHFYMLMLIIIVFIDIYVCIYVYVYTTLME